jgi:sulfide:quinone oxidoreductase
MANNDALFGVPIVSEKVRMLFGERGIETAYSHVLTAIDADRRVATFTTKDGTVERDYDYIHVIPPQRAPEVIRQSGLSWADKWTDQGWVECDMATMRHLRYDNIWALGDVAGVPKGKTAASVKWQVPVIEDGLVSAIEGTEPTETYNGYTSCPLITRVGQRDAHRVRLQEQPCPFLPRRHRSPGGALDQLADEGGCPESHLQRHAARPRLRRST